MSFKEHFNDYIDELNVGLTELANASGVSRASICRYRNGERLPDLDGENIGKLACGLANIATERGFDSYNAHSIELVLEQAVHEQKEAFALAGLPLRLRTLLDEMNLEVKGLAQSLNYDMSQIYRIRSGVRNPGDPLGFVKNVSTYVLETCSDPKQRLRLSMLVGMDRSAYVDNAELTEAVCNWLAFGKHGDEALSTHLFDIIERYDVNDYIRVFDKDDLLANSGAEVVRSKKDYFGRHAIENATNDFLATIADGASFKTVTVYSEFSTDAYEEGLKRSELFMLHIANLVKRGVHVKTIHNVNRAFDSMVVDFTMWLPLFMSGSISSYYLDEARAAEPRFQHCFLVAGDAVFLGESIAGHPESERATVTRDKVEIEFYKAHNEILLSEAKPLIEVIGPKKKERLETFLENDADTPGERLAFLCSPPLYSLEDDLLDRMLARARIDDETASQIRTHIAKKKDNVKRILEKNPISVVLSTYRKQDFLDSPPNLHLSEVFPKSNIPYTFDEYIEHLESTQAYARAHDNYRLELYKDPGYRNIRIQILRGKWALISNNKVPSRHGLITHPRLCWKMENTGVFRNVLGLQTPLLP